MHIIIQEISSIYRGILYYMQGYGKYTIYSILLYIEFQLLFQSLLRNHSNNHSSNHSNPMAATIAITIAATIVIPQHQPQHARILVIILVITCFAIAIMITSLRIFLSYSPLIWEIICIMRYPCIYQKFPTSFHNTSKFPRLYHKN